LVFEHDDRQRLVFYYVRIEPRSSPKFRPLSR